MSLWSHAAAVAAKTPESRNRLVDFLRAASILAVISGHWLLAAPYLADGRLVMGNMLELADYTKWLSWSYKVMPAAMRTPSPGAPRCATESRSRSGWMRACGDSSCPYCR